MNTTRHLPSPGRTSGQTRSDQEFLAPALSILETPPSPVGTSLLVLTCTLALMTGLWGTLGHVSISAVAPGKVEPRGQVRTVQVLESGRVFAINVANGDRVRDGDVLFTLDPARAQLQLDRAVRDQASARAEVVRRQAAIAAATSEAAFSVTWPQDLPAEVLQREADVLSAEVSRFRADRAELLTHVEQQEAEGAKLQQAIAAETRLLDVLRQPVAMQTQLQRLGIGARVNLVQAQAAWEHQNSTVVQALAQQRQLAAAMELARERLLTARNGFVADQSARLAAAHQALDRASSQVAMARVALDQVAVRATVSGTVQASNVTTVGQVFQPGQEAMRIVPDGVPLQVVANVRNQDIGFIQPGQAATIKVNAFPFTQYGTLHGRVIQVATDAVTSADARFTDGSPGQAPRAGHDQGREPVLNLVFPVTIALDGTTLAVNGREVPVSAGMQASVEIDTGSRRIIEYVLAPIAETLSSAARER